MFEHIYFFTHQADGENQEVLEDEAYQKMAEKTPSSSGRRHSILY